MATPNPFYKRRVGGPIIVEMDEHDE